MNTSVCALAGEALCLENIFFMDHPSYHDPARHDDLLAVMPGAADYEDRARRSVPPPGTPSEVADSYRWPLLDREQERHLFYQMNYLKCLAKRCLYEAASGDVDALVEGRRWLAASGKVRDLIVLANLRLVLLIAKDYLTGGSPPWGTINAGNAVLVNAVDKFDVGRGYKFSTYACWALKKKFWRDRRPGRLDLSVTNKEEEIGRQTVQETNDYEAGDDARGVTTAVTSLLEYLEPRERRVLRLRYGINAAPDSPGRMTLEEIGRRMNISKERTRQIERQAIEKSRIIAASAGLVAEEVFS